METIWVLEKSNYGYFPHYIYYNVIQCFKVHETNNLPQSHSLSFHNPIQSKSSWLSSKFNSVTKTADVMRNPVL